eukprot:TRINITY_DN681_c0_g1_i1.p1 TRINITY_DN681_c0_g1~~TRINITY_DN681_c0_g1_i1.p1  ORF type:complete len:1509 (+),score=298.77 TRINITY_DN681_c0_g1_i1:607-5133(+)
MMTVLAASQGKGADLLGYNQGWSIGSCMNTRGFEGSRGTNRYELTDVKDAGGEDSLDGGEGRLAAMRELNNRTAEGTAVCLSSSICDDLINETVAPSQLASHPPPQHLDSIQESGLRQLSARQGVFDTHQLYSDKWSNTDHTMYLHALEEHFTAKLYQRHYCAEEVCGAKPLFRQAWEGQLREAVCSETVAREEGQGGEGRVIGREVVEEGAVEGALVGEKGLLGHSRRAEGTVAVTMEMAWRRRGEGVKEAVEWKAEEDLTSGVSAVTGIAGSQDKFSATKWLPSTSVGDPLLVSSAAGRSAPPSLQPLHPSVSTIDTYLLQPPFHPFRTLTPLLPLSGTHLPFSLGALEKPLLPIMSSSSCSQQLSVSGTNEEHQLSVSCLTGAAPGVASALVAGVSAERGQIMRSESLDTPMSSASRHRPGGNVSVGAEVQEPGELAAFEKTEEYATACCQKKDDEQADSCLTGIRQVRMPTTTASGKVLSQPVSNQGLPTHHALATVSDECLPPSILPASESANDLVLHAAVIAPRGIKNKGRSSEVVMHVNALSEQQQQSAREGGARFDVEASLGGEGPVSCEAVNHSFCLPNSTLQTEADRARISKQASNEGPAHLVCPSSPVQCSPFSPSNLDIAALNGKEVVDSAVLEQKPMDGVQRKEGDDVEVHCGKVSQYNVAEPPTESLVQSHIESTSFRGAVDTDGAAMSIDDPIASKSDKRMDAMDEGHREEETFSDLAKIEEDVSATLKAKEKTGKGVEAPTDCGEGIEIDCKAGAENRPIGLANKEHEVTFHLTKAVHEAVNGKVTGGVRSEDAHDPGGSVSGGGNPSSGFPLGSAKRFPCEVSKGIDNIRRLSGRANSCPSSPYYHRSRTTSASWEGNGAGRVSSARRASSTLTRRRHATSSSRAHHGDSRRHEGRHATSNPMYWFKAGRKSAEVAAEKRWMEHFSANLGPHALAQTHSSKAVSEHSSGLAGDGSIDERLLRAGVTGVHLKSLSTRKGEHKEGVAIIGEMPWIQRFVGRERKKRSEGGGGGGEMYLVVEDAEEEEPHWKKGHKSPPGWLTFKRKKSESTEMVELEKELQQQFVEEQQEQQQQQLRQKRQHPFQSHHHVLHQQFQRQQREEVAHKDTTHSNVVQREVTHRESRIMADLQQKAHAESQREEQQQQQAHQKLQQEEQQHLQQQRLLRLKSLTQHIDGGATVSECRLSHPCQQSRRWLEEVATEAGTGVSTERAIEAVTGTANASTAAVTPEIVWDEQMEPEGKGQPRLQINQMPPQQQEEHPFHHQHLQHVLLQSGQQTVQQTTLQHQQQQIHSGHRTSQQQSHIQQQQCQVLPGQQTTPQQQQCQVLPGQQTTPQQQQCQVLPGQQTTLQQQHILQLRTPPDGHKLVGSRCQFLQGTSRDGLFNARRSISPSAGPLCVASDEVDRASCAPSSTANGKWSRTLPENETASFPVLKLEAPTTVHEDEAGCLHHHHHHHHHFLFQLRQDLSPKAAAAAAVSAAEAVVATVVANPPT